MGVVAKEEFSRIRVKRVTAREDFSKAETLSSLLTFVARNPGTSLHASLPCTPWCRWHAVNAARGGEKYVQDLHQRRNHSKLLLDNFIQLAERTLALGGEVSFEWPATSLGWVIPELNRFITRHSLIAVTVSACAVRARDTPESVLGKQWRFVTSCERLASTLGRFVCKCKAAHQRIEGKATKLTESYPRPLCRTYLGSLFAVHLPSFAPALQCLVKSKDDDAEARHVHSFSCTAVTMPGYAPCMVTKLLSRQEMVSDQGAIDAVRSEADGLLKLKTWDPSTVVEREVLVSKAKADRQEIHIGDLMSICSIKFFECPREQWKYKGRICFRGDSVKDATGAAAVFQELTASPTSIQSANANIAFGLLPGHRSETSDAPKAYCQSLLKARAPTWVCIPRELWSPAWKGKYRRPCCRLLKALYGHPESGAHWEDHLNKAIEAIGGTGVYGHPSSFWFSKSSMLLTVYVDDLLLSGPETGHAAVWEGLRKQGIDLDPPEQLDRFLGRTHTRM